MHKRSILFFVTLFFLSSCKISYGIHGIKVYKNISVDSHITEDKAIEKVILPYKRTMEKQMNLKISYTDQELRKDGKDAVLGILLADFTYEWTKDWAEKNNLPLDAVLLNTGGIRSSIGKGDILLRHIYEILPFENQLVIVKIIGKDLMALFEYYTREHRKDPVSRLYIKIVGGQLEKALVNNAEVEPLREYYVATSDYLALGGDHMKFFLKGNIIYTGVRLRDVFIDVFKKNPVVKPPVNNDRIIFED
ncbi:MAG: bifunctional NAD pyrophosphatase/5'-nucleotidase [Bergeyella sp.]|nr:bifunctional NAD pyrophosphatase/5'-nucleotidase [Bergeyella sp.]